MRIVAAGEALDEVAGLFDDYRVHYGFSSFPARTSAWLRTQLGVDGSGARLSGIAAVDGEVCGFLTWTVIPASLALGVFWQIRDLYVAPAHRRSGIARTLLRHVASEARAAGALRLSLQTETGNDQALALYRSLGFEPVEGLEILSLPLDDRLP